MYNSWECNSSFGPSRWHRVVARRQITSAISSHTSSRYKYRDSVVSDWSPVGMNGFLTRLVSGSTENILSTKTRNRFVNLQGRRWWLPNMSHRSSIWWLLPGLVSPSFLWNKFTVYTWFIITKFSMFKVSIYVL